MEQLDRQLGEEKRLPYTGSFLYQLAADLGALLERQLDATADVTVLVGGRAFPAHKAILAARSPVLRRRIEGGGFADRGPAA